MKIIKTIIWILLIISFSLLIYYFNNVVYEKNILKVLGLVVFIVILWLGIKVIDNSELMQFEDKYSQKKLKLKNNSKKYKVSFEDCLIINSSTYKDKVAKPQGFVIGKHSTYSDIGAKVERVKINSTQIKCKVNFNGVMKTLTSPSINIDLKELEIAVFMNKGVDVYLNNLNEYFFDLDFLDNNLSI